MMRAIPDPLVTNNERVKLLSNFVSAIGLGLIGFGILRPLTDSLANANLSTLWWGAARLASHGLSHYILTLIRKEAPE
jgi:hypothetical protein